MLHKTKEQLLFSRIQQIIFLIALCCAGIVYWGWSWSFFLSFLLAELLMMANLYVLQLLWVKMFLHKNTSVAIGFFLIAIKQVLLLIGAYVVFCFLPIHMIGFGAGMMMMIVLLCCSSLYIHLQDRTSIS